MSKPIPISPSLPSKAMLAEQANWLAPARSRLFRRIGIAHRKMVLDLGTGYGSVTAELSRRSSGRVYTLDISFNPLNEIASVFPGPIYPINGDGRKLPFPDNTFDLIFCQCTLMWISPLETAVREIHRSLQPGGVLVALEPDYGGLIEYPAQLATKKLWLPALKAAGADPQTGRNLPITLAQNNLKTKVNLLDELQTPSQLRFEFLHGLPLSSEQQRELANIERLAASTPIDQQIAHLPFFLITAEKI